MLTNLETRRMIKKMHDCGITYISIKEGSSIKEECFDYFVRGGNLNYKNLVLILAYTQFYYPEFLDELEDETDYIEIIFRDIDAWCDDKNEDNEHE